MSSDPHQTLQPKLAHSDTAWRAGRPKPYTLSRRTRRRRGALTEQAQAQRQHQHPKIDKHKT